MKLHLPNLDQLVNDRYISVQKHAGTDLFIYNYTPKAQYEAKWTDETLQCRGLILDAEGRIVARPFKKFFNLGEHTDPIPNEQFSVFEKMDGSLGILYWHNDLPHIATRGSFQSPQAIEGTKMIQSMPEIWPYVSDRNTTYLFEIIYPENRIVLDYGQDRKLVYLASIDNETGHDVDHSVPIESACRYDGVADIQELTQKQESNKEGYVVRFKSGLRLKVKFDEYVRLHRLFTGLSTRKIWRLMAIDSMYVDGISSAKQIAQLLKLNPVEVEADLNILKEGTPLIDHLIESIPDECHKWIKEKWSHFKIKYEAIKTSSSYLIEHHVRPEMNKKDAAALISKEPKKSQPVLFAMANKKPYNHIIWNLIEPSHSAYYRKDIDG